jgi:hypothetical protein
MRERIMYENAAELFGFTGLAEVRRQRELAAATT